MVTALPSVTGSPHPEPEKPRPYRPGLFHGVELGENGSLIQKGKR